MYKSIFVLLSLVLCSCADGRLYNNPNNGSFAVYQNDPRLALIDKKEPEKLTDAQIAQSLDYAYTFKKIKRVAFLPVGSYGQDLIGFQSDLMKEASEMAPGIEIKKIPSILLPNSPDIETLRLLSVKMQVDTLVIFNIYTNNRYKPSLFSKDQYKTALSIDFYLFDVRSGLIPYANSVDKVQEHAVGTIDSEKMEEIRRQDLYQAIRAMIGNLSGKISSEK